MHWSFDIHYRTIIKSNFFIKKANDENYTHPTLRCTIDVDLQTWPFYNFQTFQMFVHFEQFCGRKIRLEHELTSHGIVNICSSSLDEK